MWIGYEGAHILLDPLIELILVTIEVFLDTRVSPFESSTEYKSPYFCCTSRQKYNPFLKCRGFILKNRAMDRESE
jgi:hypothetical protein